MSAPTPAPGDENPREGYYPDPSIPGYVRYWNGASWVPGTSRPAPQQDGTPPATQSAGRPGTAPSPSSGPSPVSRTAPVDETGPMYLDEVEEPGHGGEGVAPPGRSLPASAWQADTSRQTGFGGERDNRVSWGGGQDPRTPEPRRPASAEDGPAGGAPSGGVPTGAEDPVRGALPGMRDGGDAVAGGADPVRPDVAGDGSGTRPPTDGTVTIRAVGRGGPARAPQPRDEGRVPAEGTMAIRAVPPAGTARPPAPATPRHRPPAPTPQPQASLPAVPQRQTPAPVTPAAPDPGGAGASWPQQGHQLPGQGQQAGPPQVRSGQPGAGPEQQPVVPWKPPVDDPFQQLARSQASARPAGLGRRFAARLVDTVVLGALVGAAAVPLVSRATDHIDRKIDAAKLSGETVTVWLLDSTTATLLGGVLAAFLVLGFLLEALPTAKWGRTLGKRLCGIEVRDIESHDSPGVGAALRRWLVYGVLGLLLVGVVGVLWCLIDRPWRQCWHDKAARTFVAG
ncbi:RDD family protein [Streptomyces sp. NPDC059166]|uniref:RDD family protein n=1 Tax=Streptomyces sp. NPDC059166 TaxID=3346752 RepID=UPI00369C8196